MRFRRGPQPEGAIRRSQLLTRAGPGALVDLIDHAIVVGGLEGWHYASPREGFFSEPRLQDKALRLLRGAGHWEHAHVRLRRPPDCDDDEPSPSIGIAAVQFPAWSLCQNDRCRSLVHYKGLNDRRRHECSPSESKDYPVVPFRFVQACPKGHLSDIHWRRFVHRGVREEDVDPTGWAYCVKRPHSGPRYDRLGDDWSSDLYVAGVGTSGDLTDYIVGCRRCGATRGLQDLVQPNILGTCPGWRPWLGPQAGEPCTEASRFLVRTASNAYFPQYVSALAIRDSSQAIRKVVDENWSALERVSDLTELRFLLRLQEYLAKALQPFDDGEIMQEIRRRQIDAPVPSPPIREAEWTELLRAGYEVRGELPKRGDDWFASRVDIPELPAFVDRVVLIQALKEVRAQIGFTRLEGFSSDAEGEYDLDGQRSAPLTLSKDWIPAVEIRGEGLFIAFDEASLRRWEARPAVQARARQFVQATQQANQLLNRSPDLFPGPRLVMLHSLAHMLITQISLECGYAASSIRERIYCYRHEGDDADARAKSRAGILLYTGTPGSEGTLGGLVEVGRDILRHLRLAAERALLCSNDPVCAQHDPAGHEEGRHREGAACHGCLLIAEPSCERMNRDLDRSLVVPTVAGGDTAFLGPWLRESFVAPAPARPARPPEPAPKPTEPAGLLDQVLANCLDDQVRDLVRAAHANGLPLPDVEPAALPLAGDVPAELTWSASRVAVCVADATTDEDVMQAREMGWTLLRLPLTVEDLEPAVRGGAEG